MISKQTIKEILPKSILNALRSSRGKALERAQLERKRAYLGTYRQDIDRYLASVGLKTESVEAKLRKAGGDDLLYFRTRNGPGQNLEALYFAAVSELMQPRKVLEIGTGRAENTKVMASLFPDAEIYSVDLPKSDKEYSKLAIRDGMEESAFRKNLARKNIHFLEMNSFLLAAKFRDVLFDFIYVDGGHTFPAVAWDTMFAYNNAAPGGIVLFHDYNRLGDSDPFHGNHVKFTMDQVAGIIPEKVVQLPYAGYDPDARICLVQKGK